MKTSEIVTPAQLRLKHDYGMCTFTQFGQKRTVSLYRHDFKKKEKETIKRYGDGGWASTVAKKLSRLFLSFSVFMPGRSYGEHFDWNSSFTPRRPNSKNTKSTERVRRHRERVRQNPTLLLLSKQKQAEYMRLYKARKRQREQQ